MDSTNTTAYDQCDVVFNESLTIITALILLVWLCFCCSSCTDFLRSILGSYRLALAIWFWALLTDLPSAVVSVFDDDLRGTLDKCIVSDNCSLFFVGWLPTFRTTSLPVVSKH